MGFVVGLAVVLSINLQGRVRVLGAGSAEAPGPVSAQRQVAGVAGWFLAPMAAF